MSIKEYATHRTKTDNNFCFQQLRSGRLYGGGIIPLLCASWTHGNTIGILLNQIKYPASRLLPICSITAQWPKAGFERYEKQYAVLVKIHMEYDHCIEKSDQPESCQGDFLGRLIRALLRGELYGISPCLAQECEECF